jgi:tetraacyldisaccharide 4'-kinase
MTRALSPFLLPVTLPAAWAYRAAVELRNHLYDRGRLKIYRLPAPVVSVGNLTVGGSGKTPLVAWLSRELAARGRRVAVLSRGYRRREAGPFLLVSDGREIQATVEEAGDEPFELARSIPGLTVAVGADRFRTGLEVIRRLGDHLFLLDDGFQHRKLFRNLDIVCLDAGEPLTSLRLLPAGRLREPLRSLGRATALLWTRWKRGLPAEALSAEVLPRLGPETAVFRAVNEIEGFSALAGEEDLSRNAFTDQPVGVLAAIARPERLREDLEETGAKVVWFGARRDHHRWDPQEIERMVDRARAAGARVVLTTGKDAVKLTPAPPVALPLYRVRLGIRIVESGPFESLLERLALPAA